MTQQQYPSYPSYPSSQQAAPPPTARRPRRWPWIVGIVVAFLVGTAMGSAGSSGAGNAASTAGATKTVQAPPSTVTVAAGAPAEAPAPAEPAAPAPAGGPLRSFSDGTYEVGTGNGQVAPGKYTSPGGGTCYWARLKHNDGELGDIIANNLGEGQMILNVKSTDGYVEIRGCEFTKA